MAAATQAPALNSKFLIDDISLKVSRALNFDSTNNTLGRTFIREALNAPDLPAFAEAAKSYGALEREFVEQLYDAIHRFNDRLVHATLAKRAAAGQQQQQPAGSAPLAFSGSFGPSKEVLEGEGRGGGTSKSARGGLILPKGGSTRHVFARPQAKSMLGLDALAAKKRDEAAAVLSKKHNLSFADDDADDDDTGDGGGDCDSKQHRTATDSTAEGAWRSGRAPKAKRMRRKAHDETLDTPTPVVNADTLEKIDRRRRRDQERGRISSRDGDRSRTGDRRGWHSDRSENRSEKSWTRRSDYNNDRRRDDALYRPARGIGSDGGDADRGDDRWEEATPSRDNRSEVWTGSSRGHTAGGTSSRRGGMTPLPTPEREDLNSRSNPDNTPMATPSYHYNSWTKDRKRSGQTPAGAGAGDGGDKAADADELDKTRGTIGRRGRQAEFDPLQAQRDREAWEEEDKRLDRSWYDMEEGSYARDEGSNPFMMDDTTAAMREAKMQKEKIGKMSSNRRAGLHEDRDRWEENRLIGSGVVTQKGAQVDFDDSTEARTQLMIHDTKPPFLDGRQVFTKQQAMVCPVKDPTSIMAQIARKGSMLLRDVREKNDRDKSRNKFWELAGSKMGNAMGLKKKERKPEKEEVFSEDADGEMDYKKDSQFANHMQKPSVAASDFSKSKSIKEQREYLPIFKCREQLMQVIRDNNVVVIVGETGSGKTTQMTQYLMEDGYGDYGVIGCTQPRRVAAMSVAKRVSEEMNCELGAQVGYAIRFEDCTSSDTVIKYMTDGVLLRESLNPEQLEQYSCIVMDEAHERSLNTDVLFGIMSEVLTKRRDMKLIVTSATLNAEKFASFYGGCPVFKIPGRTFKVEKMFSKFNCEDYVDAAVKQALQIHLSFPPGDILIFMTGQEDIEGTCRVMAERLEMVDSPPPIALLPIYSQLPSDMQAKIFEEAPDGARKCIVATNIAETSLTLDGILYVIDSGYCKLKMYNPRVGMDSLAVTPISKANANQRAGRAGRTGPGYAYRMYTESSYDDELLESTIPEIQRTNLSTVVLLLKTLGVEDVTAFAFMDPPPLDNILNSMYQLWILGALDNTGKLTCVIR
eukprot:SAG31_NODE_665_length_12992_cov_3.676181_1_plen_1090_part_00